MTTMFDSDQYDVEVIADRLSGDFNTAAMCEFFGVARTSLVRAVKRGYIPAAAYTTDTGRGAPTSVWTAWQVASIVVAGTWPQPPPRCGTRNGYRMHLRAGEEPCEPCITAAREYGRRRKMAQRSA